MTKSPAARLPSAALRTVLVCLVGLMCATPARGLNADDRAHFADGLFARGLYDMALKEYLPLLTYQPPPAALDAVLFRAGECYRLMDKTTDAAALYARLLAEFPKSEYLHRAAFRRAEINALAGKNDDALVQFQTLAAANPPPDILASALYGQGQCAARLNRGDEAIKCYRRILAEFGDSPFFSFAALALADQLQRANGKAADIKDLYARASRAPASPRVGAEAWFQLADLAYRAGDFEEASRAYEQLMKRYPTDERTPQARLQAAWAFLRGGKADETLKLCEEYFASGEKLNRSEWRYLKANCERQMGRFQASRDSYASLLREDPPHALAASATYEQALVAFEQKDYLGVLALGGGAAEHPAAEDFLWLVAESQFAVGRKTEALATHRKLTERFPTGPRVWASRFQQARLLDAQGETEAAVALFRAVVSQTGTNALAADALFQAGLCHGKLKKLEESLKDWDALIAGFPGYPDMDRALYEKAQAEVTLGRDDPARATLEKLIQQYPDRPAAGPAHFLLGVLFERRGDPARSDEQYQAALRKPGTEMIAAQIKFRRASLLQQQGKNEEAATLLQGLLKTTVLTNMQPQLLEWLARFDLQGGKAAEAEVAAQALLKASGEASWKQAGWYLTGRGRQALGRLAEARAAYEEALKVPGRTRDAMESALFLGRVALETKDYPTAEASFTRAAEMAAGDDVADIRSRSYFGLGQTARAQEKWEEAARYFLSVGVLFDDPKLTPEAMYYAAESLGKLNKATDRDKTLQELKQRYPDSEWSRK